MFFQNYKISQPEFWGWKPVTYNCFSLNHHFPSIISNFQSKKIILFHIFVFSWKKNQPPFNRVSTIPRCVKVSTSSANAGIFHARRQVAKGLLFSCAVRGWKFPFKKRCLFSIVHYHWEEWQWIRIIWISMELILFRGILRHAFELVPGQSLVDLGNHHIVIAGRKTTSHYL